ncbi:NAD(P)-dependent oxidoreductase [Paenibacillus filicis]|uniref:NAD(P)-dependent oxidoreductase n=1 Tax=Paenibacillus gyeongsangnamensis TaxID=3388067 RepID=A0ABT4QEI3_9BACL|nr:NAD(P)-dependent oxidoreductase [Paenibacillus filicis]MCZ8515288.1 NAD(P)-dependent oxidoreductase [Paenibacillus filicis]
MKVLITGAGGNLGRVLGPALEEKGYEPVLMDYRDIETPYLFIRGDVTNKADVLKAVQGSDAIVHAAALHGIHLSKYSRDDFWKLNVQGTYNVYDAALECGVGKILLCSTMGVYGKSIQGSQDGFAAVTEQLPLKPKDFYGMSKTLCEEIGQYYNRSNRISTIAYRLGMFVPEDYIRYGFRLLKGGVDDRDVAQAFLLGLENDSIDFDAFNIMAEVPFSKEELNCFRKEPASFMEERYPGLSELIARRGQKAEELLQMWGYTHWSIEKAKERLGYKPTYNFKEFYTALREGHEESYYPYANLPWWGM